MGVGEVTVKGELNVRQMCCYCTYSLFLARSLICSADML